MSHNFHVDDSAYIEQFFRRYGDGSDGYMSLLQSIELFAQEDPWQDLQILLWLGDSGALWRLYTSQMYATLVAMARPRAAINRRLYFGSVAPFYGLAFDINSTAGFTGLSVQYWNGVWAALAVTDGTASGGSTLEVSGDITWTTGAAAGWVASSLTGVEATNDISSNIDDIDINGIVLYPATVANSNFTTKYWIRITATGADSESLGITTVNITNPFPQSRWDYYAEDPKFFHRVGRWDGAAWNDSTVNSWSTSSTTNFNFLSVTTHRFYFGSTYKFAGIEFDLATNGNYAGVIITWEYFNGRTGVWVSIPGGDVNSYAFGGDGSTRWNVYGLDFRNSDPAGTDYWGTRNISLDHAGAPSTILYWVRASIDIVPATMAVISNCRTISIASFKYFERGTEPYDSTVHPAKILGTKLSLANQLLTGVELVWRGYSSLSSEANKRVIPIVSYEFDEQPIEAVTRVAVHGRGGVSGRAVNSTRENDLGIIKEKMIVDWTIEVPAEAETRAAAILRTFEPSSATAGIRRGIIDINQFPLRKDQASNFIPVAPMRVGDVVAVTVSDAGLSLSQVLFLIHKIEYTDSKASARLTLSRDLLPSMPERLSMGDQVRRLNNRVLDAEWTACMPSGKSVTELIFNTTEGSHSPVRGARLRRVAGADANRDRVDLDDFIGTDSSVSLNASWSRQLSVFKRRGGALGFVGTTASNEADIDTGNGRIYYDTTSDVFKARIERGEQTANTFRFLPAGEWGVVAVAGGTGRATVTFVNQYSAKPRVIATIDQTTAGAASGLMVEVDAWPGAPPPYTQVRFRVLRTDNIAAPHTHNYTLTRGGAINNVQIANGGGSLFSSQVGPGTVITTSDSTSPTVTLSVASDGVEIMYLVIADRTPILPL